MRSAKEKLILRLRLREMTIDGIVDGSGPWIVAKTGRKFLGSAALGECTKIFRKAPDRPYCVIECSNTIQIVLDRCDEPEIQAISTTFGIPGRIEFHGDYRNRPIFPYAPRYLFESPFWEAMQACATDDPNSSASGPRMTTAPACAGARASPGKRPRSCFFRSRARPIGPGVTKSSLPTYHGSERSEHEPRAEPNAGATTSAISLSLSRQPLTQDREAIVGAQHDPNPVVAYDRHAGGHVGKGQDVGNPFEQDSIIAARSRPATRRMRVPLPDVGQVRRG